MAHKSSSKHRQDKYSSHPVRAKANKVRKIKKHLKKCPKDLQSQEALGRHGG